LYGSPNIIKTDQVKEHEMGRACGTNGEKRNAYRILVGKSERKRPLGRPRRRWEDNIRMDLFLVSLGGVRLSPLGTSATVGLLY
jgi:hypothetical protein